jgi:hypothetical protein
LNGKLALSDDHVCLRQAQSGHFGLGDLFFNNEKAPALPGLLSLERDADQYFATTGPPKPPNR